MSGRQHESKKISTGREGGGWFIFLPGCIAHMVIKLWENLAAQTGVNRSQPTLSFPDRVLIGELVVKVDSLHILISVGISALP